MPHRPDWTTIWKLATKQFALGEHSLHGPVHWHAVQRNGLDLGARVAANETVVRLFAVLHDAKRFTEASDPEHGQRAGQWAAEMRGVHFRLDDDAFGLLIAACEGHDYGLTSDDPTIGACWDADRLELPRVGIRPDPKFFSTAEGKRRAGVGWLEVR